jgi:hypothetical protein
VTGGLFGLHYAPGHAQNKPSAMRVVAMFRCRYGGAMPADRLRQIVYSSRAVGRVDADAILQASRHNNALDGVSGMLWIDGNQIVQVIEGPEQSVAAIFARIQADPRHTDVEVLSTREVTERDFGYWSMELADRVARDPEQQARLSRRIHNLPENLRRVFEENEQSPSSQP